MTFQMPTSLPEPTSTKTKNGKGPYGQVERSVEARWVLNPEAAAEGLPTVFVRMTTMHTTSWQRFEKSSGYQTLMTWGTAEPAKEGSIFSVETWGSDHTTKRIAYEPVARHSLKAMQKAHEEAMATASDYFEQVAPIFAEAAERNGLLVTEEV